MIHLPKFLQDLFGLADPENPKNSKKNLFFFSFFRRFSKKAKIRNIQGGAN